jgi:hypothetical protein
MCTANAPQPTQQDKVAIKSQATMMRIGGKLLADSKREIAENGTFETGRGRDLLTLLVRANTAKDVPEAQRLSDKDVLARASLLHLSHNPQTLLN